MLVLEKEEKKNKKKEVREAAISLDASWRFATTRDPVLRHHFFLACCVREETRTAHQPEGALSHLSSHLNFGKVDIVIIFLLFLSLCVGGSMLTCATCATCDQITAFFKCTLNVKQISYNLEVSSH